MISNTINIQGYSIYNLPDYITYLQNGILATSFGFGSIENSAKIVLSFELCYSFSTDNENSRVSDT